MHNGFLFFRRHDCSKHTGSTNERLAEEEVSLQSISPVYNRTRYQAKKLRRPVNAQHAVSFTGPTCWLLLGKL